MRITKTGFTLIELLVVIAIVAILSAMLLPALSRARHGAVKAQCASDMHQVHVATATYELSWASVPFNNVRGGAYRYALKTDSYQFMLKNYLKSDLDGLGGECPSLRPKQVRHSGYMFFGNYTLGRPSHPGYDGKTRPRTFAQLERSARRAKECRPDRHFTGKWILMCDRIQIDEGTVIYDFESDNSSDLHDTGAVAHAYRHKVTGANILWIDGNVEWRVMPGGLTSMPLPGNGQHTDTDRGWIRHGVFTPRVDAMVPIETVDIMYTSRWNGKVRTEPSLVWNSPYIALEH